MSWYVLDKDVEQPKKCEMGSASQCELDSAGLDNRDMHIFVYICYILNCENFM